MRRSLALLLGSLALTLAGCPKKEPACTPENEKAEVLDVMRSYYLYPDLLQQVSPTDPAYPTVSSYLDALTASAREAGMDRGWTYATTATQTQAFYDEGTSVGFGLGLLQRNGTQELVAQVFPGSAAADAGFVRGDELLAIGETPDTLVDVPTLIAAGTLGAALGPSTAGVTRTFRVLPLGGTDPVADAVLRTATKRTYALDPVPAGAVLIPQGAGVPPVGYVALRTFITPAEPLLQDAFLQFQQAGVQEVVVDLRYNGGGLITTAYLLANLLGGGRSTANAMFRLENNALHASEDSTVAFDPPPQAIAPSRIAFITTGASASASELVPNVHEAYLGTSVALVGAKTYGKPVGQRGFVDRGCDLAVYLVAFRIANAQGDGGYYDGLPDAAGKFSGPLCAAPDDLTRPQWDPAEASTAAALEWLATGACPAPVAAKPSGPAAAPRAATLPDAYPEAPAPDEAQRNVRGLF
jgi:C-terminal processing protease CtpA/Prc